MDQSKMWFPREQAPTCRTEDEMRFFVFMYTAEGTVQSSCMPILSVVHSARRCVLLSFMRTHLVLN